MGGTPADSASGGLGGLAAQLLAYVAAAVFVPILVAMAAFFLLPASVEGPIAVSLAVLTCVLVLASIGRRTHPITTIGVATSLTTTAFTGESERCADCDAHVARGRYRQFSKEIVVFGYSVYQLESGANPYCIECAEQFASRSTADRRGSTETASERLSELDS